MDIGWNCLGGGIQYLLPTMIVPGMVWHRIGDSEVEMIAW